MPPWLASTVWKPRHGRVDVQPAGRRSWCPNSTLTIEHLPCKMMYQMFMRNFTFKHFKTNIWHFIYFGRFLQSCDQTQGKVMWSPFIAKRCGPIIDIYWSCNPIKRDWEPTPTYILQASPIISVGTKPCAAEIQIACSSISLGASRPAVTRVEVS